MQPRQRTVSRHISAASVDTNASAIAESTISLGLSRFPEPPTSIPSTPIRSHHNSPSSSLRNFPRPSAPPVVPLRKVRPPDKATTSHTHSSKFTPSLTTPQTHTSDPPKSSSSSHIVSAFDWHDGASSIDVDAAEDRLLPTSFITSLLQENQKLRKSKRGSNGSDAFSGISEMTYPPLANRPMNIVSGDYLGGKFPAHHTFEDPRPPPSSYPLRPSRTSSDSATLNSFQGSSSMVPGTSDSKTNRYPFVGVSPPLQSVSNSSQISSIQDSDTLGSTTHGYQRKLSTAYESGDEAASDYKPVNPSFHQADTAGPQRRLLKETPQQQFSRDSLHSHHSAAPSFMSRISGLSLRRVFNWRKTKPLPPVPKIPNISIEVENAYRKEDESAPLPDLVNRAGVLRDLLDKGHHPHQSLNSYHVLPAVTDPSIPREIYEAEARKQGYADLSHLSQLSPLHKRSTSPPTISKGSPVTRSRKRVWLTLSIIGFLSLVAIGVGVGVTMSKKKPTVAICPVNFTGSLCSLDASCVCTSATGCNGLAQSIVDLLPTVNQVFGTNITGAIAYSSIWIMQGSPTTRSCSSQALLIDVGTSIGPEVYPNRTRWAQAALLWNAIQTQDMTSAQRLQETVQALPWESIADVDGPVVADSTFAITSSGFIFNFASQTFMQPPASFKSLGQPPSAQLSQVSNVSIAALDRMYTYAQASAIQRQTALKLYWTSVLLRRPEDLSTFKTAISLSPIVLPFNASSPSIRNLYQESPPASFPPPLSCFPGLNGPVLQAINNVETNVFGLQSISNVAQFDPQCYPNRPVYGVLNILRLRLPFLDSLTGLNRQAVVLTKDVNSRAILYNGRMFSSVSGAAAQPPSFTPSQLNPRQYGTLVLSDHVLLQYLTSISDLKTANNLIQFVLDASGSATPIPPQTTSPLFQSLSALPSLEVAVFGAVLASDQTSTVSPFTNPSSALFFGSADGGALRNWTITSSSGTVAWTENATSPAIVNDRSLADTTSISKVWNAASLGITFNVSSITITNVTSSLQATNSFSPV